jgi:hypothetical protein
LNAIDDVIKSLHTAKKNIAIVDKKSIVDAKTIKKWEKLTKFTLPDDFKQFLEEIGGCKLHPGNHATYAMRVFGLPEVQPYSTLIDDPDEFGVPASWFAIADLQDGNFVLMDLATTMKSRVNIMDGFHEELGLELEIIAKSFTEFMQIAIKDSRVSSGGGSGRKFWSKGGPSYGEVAFDA